MQIKQQGGATTLLWECPKFRHGQPHLLARTGSSRDLTHCPGRRTLFRTLWVAVGLFLTKFKMLSPYDVSIMLLAIYPKC